MLLIAAAFIGGLAVEHYLGIWDKSVGRLWSWIRNKV
jgi:hypothetical protein